MRDNRELIDDAVFAALMAMLASAFVIAVMFIMAIWFLFF